MMSKTKVFQTSIKILLPLCLIVAVGIGFFFNYTKDFDIKKIAAQSDNYQKKMAVKVQKIQYKNLTAYLIEEHSNPIIAISFIFKHAGYAYDDKNQLGISQISAKMLLNGAGKYKEDEFASILEENGIKMGFGVTADDFSGYLITPSANRKTAYNLLKQVFLNPRLDGDSLELTKQKQLMSLQKQNEHPHSQLSLAFDKEIYANTAYARNALGKKEDIEKLTDSDIKKYLLQALTSHKLIIGMSGDLDAAQAQNILKEIFAKLPTGNPLDGLQKIEYYSKGKQIYIKRDTPQSITRISAHGTYRNSADFYPLYLANYILGSSGLTSRLSIRMREEQGLTYGVYTYLTMKDFSALIEGEFSVAPQDYDKAKAMFEQEWLKMGNNGISAKELELAKKSLIDSFNLRFAETSALADMLVLMQKHNLGTDFLDNRNDYIQNVGLEQVNAAAKKYFSVLPDFITIGKEEEKTK